MHHWHENDVHSQVAESDRGLSNLGDERLRGITTIRLQLTDAK